MAKYPDINLKRDVPVTDIYGKKSVIDAGEALTPYELKGNKVLLQDGETYIVSKNQYQNIKGQSVSGEVKEFAPELKGTEETIKGGKDPFAGWNDKKVAEHYAENFDGDPTGKTRWEIINDISRKLDEDMPMATERGIEDTKYSQYQLPEGKNYKEILIKAPKDEIKSLNWQTLDNGGALSSVG